MSANRLDPGRTSSGGSDRDSGGSSGGGGASGSSRTTTPTRGRSSGSSSSSSGTGSTGTSSGGTTGSQTESELVRGRTGGTVDASESSGPGRIASAIGSVGSQVGSSAVGRSVGGGFDGAFGDSMSDSGALGGVDDRLRSAEQGFESGFVDRIRRAPVDDEFERFGRDVTAQTASFLNPAGFTRDALTATEAAGRGVQRVTGGPESVQSAGESTADFARSAPELARSGGEFVRENPRDAAVTGTAVLATAGIGAAGVRGARGVGSAVNDFDGPGLSDLASDTRATTTGRQRGSSGGDDSPITLDGEDIAARQSDPDQTSIRPELERGDDIGAASPLQRRRDQLQRGDRVVDDRSPDLAFRRSLSDDARILQGETTPASTATTSSTTPFGAEAGAGGLGVLSAANDPTGIADFDSTSGRAGGLGMSPAFGGGTGGALDAANDPSGVSGTETRLEPVSGFGTGGDSTIDSDTAGTTDSTTGTDTTTGTGTRVATAKATLTGMSDAFGTTTATLSDAEMATYSPTTATPRPGRPPSRPGRPRPPTLDLPDGNDELAGFDTETDDDVFGTGILSGGEAFEEAFGSR